MTLGITSIQLPPLKEFMVRSRGCFFNAKDKLCKEKAGQILVTHSTCLCSLSHSRYLEAESVFSLSPLLSTYT